MRNLLTICFLLLTAATLAQNKDKAYVEEQLLTFEASLKAKGITDFFYTQRFCNGTIEMFVMPDGTKCFSSGNYIASYVFWKEDDVAFSKQIDNCGMFETVPLENPLFFDDVMKHYNTYQNKPVKTYMVSRKKNEPSSRTAIENCLRVFKFNQGEVSFKQYFKLIDLTSVEEEPNIHYSYNKELEIVALDKKLDSIIPALKNHPNYKRQQ